MRKFIVAAMCGDGLRPELQELFNRPAIDRRSELFVRSDGMTQCGPDPVREAADVDPINAVEPSPPASPIFLACRPSWRVSPGSSTPARAAARRKA